MTKHLSLLLSAFSLVVYSQSAMAAFSVDELHTATKAAVEDFKRAHAEHVAHFTGYKSWLSGEESKVKIYVAHDGMTMDFSYLCHKHEASIECHAQ